MNQFIQRYKLSKEQSEVYKWLKEQHLNTDDNTLCFWCKTYTSKRIQEVVNFAKARQAMGQSINNIGGWIQKFLKEGQAVVDENCRINRTFATNFVNSQNWNTLIVYEKYVRDTITDDDLPLNLAIEDFKRSLVALYEKSQLYRQS